ncbi:MAG: head decoration protein [Bryobacterales bacterium]|jgi:hypothetical protein|nr:head decoration protein [Bryobacterales bacterium]
MLTSRETNSYSPDKLIAGNSSLLETRKVTIVSGQNIVRGAVLGKITTGGKYRLSLAAPDPLDGSQIPDAIALENCDASAGDKEAMVYIRGDFNENALTIGAGHSADSIREGLRDKGIHLSKALAY